MLAFRTKMNFQGFSAKQRPYGYGHFVCPSLRLFVYLSDHTDADNQTDMVMCGLGVMWERTDGQTGRRFWNILESFKIF